MKLLNLMPIQGYNFTKRLLLATLMLTLFSIGGPNRIVFAVDEIVSALIDDTSFEQGFVVLAPKSGKKVRIGKLIPIDNRDEPVWEIAQWHSRFDLAQASCETVSPGVYRFADGAKSVILDYCQPDESVLTLGLEGTTEYDGKPPERGDPWPHLLIERPLTAHPALVDLATVPFRISYRLIKQEADRLEGWNKRRHTAQFLLYITLQNQNRASAGHGDYLWFGVSMYDARHRHTPPHKTADRGSKKKQGTGKFIFNPAGKRYTPESAHEGQWITIEHDLLPLMKESLAEAWKKGFLSDSHDIRDYHLGGLNFGWEVTGTWNVAMQVKGLRLGATKLGQTNETVGSESE
jgi:hypothetical protein